MKRLIVLGALVGALFFAPHASATNDGVCTGNKIDVSGSHATLTLAAPEGFLISGYCVKAGSVKQGEGPEYYEVDPPAVSVTIEHSSGKDISHYSLFLVEDPTPPTTTVPAPTTTIPPTTTVVGSSTTTVVPTTTVPTSTTVPTPTVSISAAPSVVELPTELAYTGINAWWLASLGVIVMCAGLCLMRYANRLNQAKD